MLLRTLPVLIFSLMIARQYIFHAHILAVEWRAQLQLLELHLYIFFSVVYGAHAGLLHFTPIVVTFFERVDLAQIRFQPLKFLIH